jgi:hypothetical protein
MYFYERIEDRNGFTDVHETSLQALKMSGNNRSRRYRSGGSIDMPKRSALASKLNTSKLKRWPQRSGIRPPGVFAQLCRRMKTSSDGAIKVAITPSRRMSSADPGHHSLTQWRVAEGVCTAAQGA